MIIGFDGSRAFLGERSGTENYSFQLLRALSKIDKTNQYIIYIRPQPITYTIVDHIGKLSDNFQFKVINWPRLWTQGGLAARTFTDKLDVLFIPAHTLPVVRKPGLKTVVTVHDLGSEYLPRMHQVKQRLYLSFMQKVQLQGATKIIAVSKATQNDLVKKIGLDPHKISVIYEGFDKQSFSSNKQSFSSNKDLFKPVKKEKNYFLFVGTVQPRKNLGRIIKAISCTKENLVIVGQKGWLSDEIYALPKKLGIENRVKFLGYLPDEKLPALYLGAIALVFPSLFEGFGLPILEAQASGCPIITSNVSSMPEVAGKGAILIDPYNIDEIVNAMIKVQDEKIRGQLIRAGFENIKRFSWEKCAVQTLKVFEEL
ncbi:glycosyltransferase family 4 protein [Candidatus Daviesbacteria bacterium]|nr:glycosyltransferase family 4 protein [Candidatus Daviesbacteria bacterium]